MSIYEELSTLNHQDLIKLSGLVHKLLQWDTQMTWDEALQQAYDRVLQESDWMKSLDMDQKLTRYC